MIRALLVEDDRGHAEKCIEVLDSESFEVTLASDADEARCMLLDREFDLAVVDLMLPPKFDAEGLDLGRFINRYRANVKLLFMTSRDTGMVEIVAEAMKLGASYFIDKGPENFESRLRFELRNMKKEMSSNIFLSHGHNELLKLKIKDFLVSKLGQIVVVLSEQPSAGLTVVEKLERVSEKCCFAVVLMTRDDQQASGGMRARQNVIHEIGFLQGKLGRSRVALVAEKGVEQFSNISGIVRIEFDSGQFDQILEALRTEIESALKTS